MEALNWPSFIYIFRPDYDPYSRDAIAEDMLVPPTILCHDEWKRGAFLVVPELRIDFELPEHAFYVWVTGSKYKKGQLVNEFGEVLRFEEESEKHMPRGVFYLEKLETKMGPALDLIADHAAWIELPALEHDNVLISNIYEVKLPFTELEALDVGSYDIEDEILANRKLCKLGELVEVGSSQTERHFLFHVPPRRRKGFLNELQLELKARGVRNYKVINCDTGEQVV